MSSPHHYRHPGTAQLRKHLHKDWRMWVAVALMLAAIVIYVLTLDDSLLSLVLQISFC